MTKFDHEPFRMLERCEAALRRMIAGVFHFMTEALPQWLRKSWDDLLGWLGNFSEFCIRFAVRLGRVVFFALVWMLLVFGIPVVAISLGSDSGMVILLAVVWMCLGISGSVWGLYRLRV